MSRIPLFIIGAVIVGFSFVFGLGYYLSKSANQTVEMPNDFENLSINGTKGSVLRAGNSVCALLMHGVRSNRSSMVGRALFLRKYEITSLSIDLQAHGETPGNEITFGIRESIDAANGVKYLRDHEKCAKIVSIGVSLGGASSLLGNGPIESDAFILESVYPTIQEAVRDRLEIRLGQLGRVIAPLLYRQIPIRTGISLAELRPIEAIKNVHVPIFIIAGTEDQHTKVDETKRMYENANQIKELWLVDGAVHEDLYSFNKRDYEAKIISFIKQHLQ